MPHLRSLARCVTLFGLSASLAACGNAHAPVTPESAAPLQPAAKPVSAPAGFPQLPSPAQLAQLPPSRAASAPGTYLDGSAFAQSASHAQVETLPDSDPIFATLTCSPQFAPLADPPQTSLAYALYNFTALPADAQPVVSVGFWQGLPSGNQAWLAAANFATGRWDWFKLAGSPLSTNLGTLTDYISSTTQSWFCVATTGTTPCELRWINAGEPASSYAYLTSDLDNDPLFNIGPRMVTWTINTKLPGAEISGIDADLDGDGVNDIIGGLASELQFN